MPAIPEIGASGGESGAFAVQTTVISGTAIFSELLQALQLADGAVELKTEPKAVGDDKTVERTPQEGEGAGEKEPGHVSVMIEGLLASVQPMLTPLQEPTRKSESAGTQEWNTDSVSGQAAPSRPQVGNLESTDEPPIAGRDIGEQTPPPVASRAEEIQPKMERTQLSDETVSGLVAPVESEITREQSVNQPRTTREMNWELTETQITPHPAAAERAQSEPTTNWPSAASRQSSDLARELTNSSLTSKHNVEPALRKQFVVDPCCEIEQIEIPKIKVSEHLPVVTTPPWEVAMVPADVHKSRVLGSPGIPTTLLDTPPVSHSAFHIGRMTERIAGSELQFDWKTQDSGVVQVRTALHDQVLSLGVKAERKDTESALWAELPLLNAQLREQSMSLGEVKIWSSGALAMNMDSQGNGHAPNYLRQVLPQNFAGMEQLDVPEGVDVPVAAGNGQSLSLLA